VLSTITGISDGISQWCGRGDVIDVGYPESFALDWHKNVLAQKCKAKNTTLSDSSKIQ